MYDKSGLETEETVNSAHLVRVTLCEVVVYRNYVYTLSGERVKVCGEGSYESLTFTRSHLRDTSLVEKNTTHKLYAEGTLAEHSVVSLTHECECLGENIVECLSVCKVTLELVGVSTQLGIGHRREFICKRLDGVYHRHKTLYLLFTVCFENTHF